MTTHNRNQEAAQNARDKFPEPRGWAMNWDGGFGAPANQTSSTTPARVTMNGSAARNPFPEPRGWAACWDGTALSELQGREDGRVK